MIMLVNCRYGEKEKDGLEKGKRRVHDMILMRPTMDKKKKVITGNIQQCT